MYCGVFQSTAFPAAAKNMPANDMLLFVAVAAGPDPCLATVDASVLPKPLVPTTLVCSSLLRLSVMPLPSFGVMVNLIITRNCNQVHGIRNSVRVFTD